MSDAGATDTAVEARPQGPGERILKGTLGGVQILLIGIPAASAVSKTLGLSEGTAASGATNALSRAATTAAKGEPLAELAADGAVADVSAVPRAAAAEGAAPSSGLPAGLQNLKPGDPIPDGLEIVVRGSNNKPGNFILRPGIDDAPLGAVTQPGKSATIATDLQLETEIPKMFGRQPVRFDALSGAFVEDVRAAGFDIIYAPTTANPFHVRIVPDTAGFDAAGVDWLSTAFDNLGKAKQ